MFKATNQTSSSAVKTINLALQGGGSHGAFTWGVLDRLLEEEGRLHIEGISGTSGGALNAVMFVQGYAQGGAQGARAALEKLWTRMGSVSVFSPGQRTIFDHMMGNWNIDASPGTMMLDMMGRMFAPAQINPLNLNPLRDMLTDLINIESIHNCAAFKLFIAATNVETGRVQVFERDHINLDVLMASSCLPFTFPAVKINGIPYWDGGYSSNPALAPLVHLCQSSDIAIIQLIPLTRKGTPSTLSEIINRLDEISFNASLLSELRTIHLIEHLIDEGSLVPGKNTSYKRMNIHMIQDEHAITHLGATSKLNTEMAFLLHLKNLGREAASNWLEKSWDSIGVRSSVDLDRLVATDSHLADQVAG